MSDLVNRVLKAKEARRELQQKILSEFKLPLISLTLNLPGGYELYKHWEVVYQQAQTAIANVFSQDIIHSAHRIGRWGPESFYVIKAKAMEIKKKAIIIEESHALGRLFDIDVVTFDKETVSRRDLSQAERRCLVCNNRALDCYKRKQHSLRELAEKVNQIIEKLG